MLIYASAQRSTPQTHHNCQFSGVQTHDVDRRRYAQDGIAIAVQREPHVAVHGKSGSHNWTRVERQDICSIALGTSHALLHERRTNALPPAFWINDKHTDDWPSAIEERRLRSMRRNVRDGTYHRFGSFGNDQFADRGERG